MDLEILGWRLVGPGSVHFALLFELVSFVSMFWINFSLSSMHLCFQGLICFVMFSCDIYISSMVGAQNCPVTTAALIASRTWQTLQFVQRIIGIAECQWRSSLRQQLLENVLMIMCILYLDHGMILLFLNLLLLFYFFGVLWFSCIYSPSLLFIYTYSCHLLYSCILFQCPVILTWFRNQLKYWGADWQV